jgi:hypothetical protein
MISRFIPPDYSSHFTSLPSKLFSPVLPTGAGAKIRFFNINSSANYLSCSFSLRIAYLALLASFQKFLTPLVMHVLVDAFPTAQLCNLFSSAEYFLRVLRRISPTVDSTDDIVLVCCLVRLI